MPLFHVHGLVASTLATLATGGTVVVPGKFSPLSFWRDRASDTARRGIRRCRRSTSCCWRASKQGAAKPAGAEKLRFIRSCSASLPPQVLHDLEAAFGAPVLEAYGMTEAAHQMASNPLPPRARMPGSVGPAPTCGISIIDDKGNQLAAGERGEVVHQGPERDHGLREQSRGQRHVVLRRLVPHRRPGLPRRDGYLTLVGRLKELINRGGEKISPREIDEVLLTHPAVAEAVCFGVPHKMWGEEVEAAVTLKGTVSEADLLAYCKEKLSDFKRPKQIHITETIPRTATGKIQRRVVAQAFAAARRAQ